MELEKAIERLEKDAKKPYYHLARKEITICDVDDLMIVLHYIKEESIPREVVEEKIKAKIEEVKDGTFDAKIVLQSLLEKE